MRWPLRIRMEFGFGKRRRAREFHRQLFKDFGVRLRRERPNRRGPNRRPFAN